MFSGYTFFDLPYVKPLTKPNSKLFYIDVVYDNIIFELENKVIDKLNELDRNKTRN